MPFQHKQHVLVVDDDRRLRTLLQRYLAAQGYLVTALASVAEAEELIATFVPDLMILDIMMPVETGLNWLQRVDLNIPVILLTALGDSQDRITGLEAGADDYLAKPFEPRELLLRMQTILKRTAKPVPKTAVTFGKFRYDLEAGLLFADGENISLTAAEKTILAMLAAAYNEAISREELMRGISGTENTDSRSVDITVTRLRKKIETNPRQPVYLQTVRGVGYCLRV